MPRLHRELLALLLFGVLLGGCAGGAPRPAQEGAVSHGHLRAAFELMQAGDDVRAEAELRRLLEQRPDDAAVQTNLGIVLARSERPAEAVVALERAVALAPDAAVAYNELGIACRRAGDFARAAEAYREALRLQPEFANAHYNLGVLLDLYLRQPGAALPHYEAYLAHAGAEDKQVQAWVKDLQRRAAAGPTTASASEEVERR